MEPVGNGNEFCGTLLVRPNSVTCRRVVPYVVDRPKAESALKLHIAFCETECRLDTTHHQSLSVLVDSQSVTGFAKRSGCMWSSQLAWNGGPDRRNRSRICRSWRGRGLEVSGVLFFTRSALAGGNVRVYLAQATNLEQTILVDVDGVAGV